MKLAPKAHNCDPSSLVTKAKECLQSKAGDQFRQHNETPVSKYIK